MSTPPLSQDDVSRSGADPDPGYPISPGVSRFPLLAALLRGLLIALAIVVAAGFILVFLPQRAVDKTAATLRARTAPPALPERIAFLYLGDEAAGGEFHIRGVVRNIATVPVEKLDATVRLYSAEGRLLETRVVRMDAETIAPDGIAQFNLIYPDYRAQFGSYSVDFMLRDGEPVPYKDMRASRGKD